MPKIEAGLTLGDGDPGFLWTLIEVAAERGNSRYALPLTVKWSRLDRAAHGAAASVLAPVRRGAREGMLIDAVERSRFRRLAAVANACRRHYRAEWLSAGIPLRRRVRPAARPPTSSTFAP